MDEIRHFFASFDGLVTTVLEKQILLSKEKAEACLDLGGVYLWKKRLTRNWRVQKGDYLRVHLKPRRFACLYSWKERIIHECADFLIVDKPRGLPVHATVDNMRENLLACLEIALKQKLFITHRIDQTSEGLVVIAKSKAFQKFFNAQLKTVRKEYVAYTETQVALGPLTHFMMDSPRAPKRVRKESFENGKLCRLEVLSSEPYSLVPQGYLFKNQILLETGRTHQIRAQLAAIGAPIVGDCLYGSPFNPSLFRLISARLNFLGGIYQTSVPMEFEGSGDFPGPFTGSVSASGISTQKTLPFPSTLSTET